MKILPLIALYLCLAQAALAAGATTKTGTAGGTTTVTTPNAGETGGLIGPYGYQPYTPNQVGIVGAVPTIGPIAPVGPAENTPITTAPPAGDDQAGAGAAAHVQSVYGACSTDAQGQSVKQLISWGCHAADGTEISASQCQAPASIVPCN
jgi:hypothetical protein